MVNCLAPVSRNLMDLSSLNFRIGGWMEGVVKLVYHFAIPQLGTLPWQPIKVARSAFFVDQSSLSHCHSKMDCNIAIPVLKINWHEFLCIVYNFGEIRFSNPRVYTLLIITTFATIRQKSAYHAK